MVGILCNKKKEMFILRKFHKLSKSLNTGNDIPIIVFTLKDLNLQEKTVSGWVITCKIPYKTKVKLPAIIFNLAVQLAKSEIKSIRTLMELEGTWLINITNRYNQWTIAEILSSNPEIKQYILPHIVLDVCNNHENLQFEGNYIIKPLRGSNLLKNIYIKQSDFTLMECGRSIKDYHIKGYSIKGDNEIAEFENIIYQIIQKIKRKRLLLIKTPELLTCNSQLCVTRIYAQRNYNGRWETLTRMSFPHNKICYNTSMSCNATEGMINNTANNSYNNSYRNLDSNLDSNATNNLIDNSVSNVVNNSVNNSISNAIDNAASMVINYINCFISDTFFCFVDFITDFQGIPYFLNYGGWDNKVLSRKQDMSISMKIYKNILGYSNTYINQTTN